MAKKEKKQVPLEASLGQPVTSCAAAWRPLIM